MSDVAKWRQAYQGINLSDEALDSAGPFPSLYVGDYLVFLERMGADAQTLAIVKAMSKELTFAYGGWAKAISDGDPCELLDRLAHATTEENIMRFISDWRMANGYPRKTLDGTPDFRLPSIDTIRELNAAALASSGGMFAPPPPPGDDNAET